MRIYTPIEFTPDQRDRLQRQLVAHQVVFGSKLESDRPKFEDAQIVFGSVPGDWLARSKTVRWVQLDSTGFSHYRHLNWDELGKRITVTNLPGIFAEPAAETALAGLLALLRGIDKLLPLQAEKRWNGLEVRWGLGSLHGATALIAGYGRIGRRIAALLAPFGCKIISFAPGAADATIRTQQQLDEALPSCDVVFSAMPETPLTIGMFSAARIARFKRGAILVNVGRGSAADELALVAALESGRLGGAALDVTVKEPLPADHPLWSAPNCILTQHTGGGSRDEHDKKPPFFLENLRRYESGEPLIAVVNWSRGY